jgi:hypothetical protein
MGRGQAPTHAAAGWPTWTATRQRSASGVLAEIIRADKKTRYQLLHDSERRQLAQTELQRQYQHTLVSLGGRQAAERVIAQHSANLHLPKSMFRPLKSPYFGQLLEVTGSVFDVLPRRGPHYRQRANRLARQRCEREMPDVDLASEEGQELLRLINIRCAPPYRWSRSSQDRFLWLRLLDARASWEPEQLLADYDAYINQLIIQWRRVSSINLDRELAFARQRLANIAGQAETRAASASA